MPTDQTRVLLLAAEPRADVHGVVARALAGVTGPVSRRDLDADMGRALRLWAAPASSAT